MNDTRQTLSFDFTLNRTLNMMAKVYFTSENTWEVLILQGDLEILLENRLYPSDPKFGSKAFSSRDEALQNLLYWISEFED